MTDKIDKPIAVTEAIHKKIMRLKVEKSHSKANDTISFIFGTLKNLIDGLNDLERHINTIEDRRTKTALKRELRKVKKDYLKIFEHI